MKILHCCLSAFYVDNYSYQENILPKMHKLQGHEVEIVASTETFLNNNSLGYTQAGTYYNENNIKVTRLPYIDILPQIIVRKLRIYNGLKNVLEQFKPDIIFLHNVQFISIKEIVHYINKTKNVQVFADNHTDYINSARGWLSKNILHKIIYKWCVKKIEPFLSVFWGVTPSRIKFLIDIYDVDQKKIDLLMLGVDDSIVNFSERNKTRNLIRNQLLINNDDFVIITGGKIDIKKNIHVLIKVIVKLKIKKIKLIVFGSYTKNLKNELSDLLDSDNIIDIGWLPSNKIYDYLFAADLAFFPGTHSVLWEQAVGAGIPCVFKEWEGFKHVDLNGNCMFVKDGTFEEIRDIILYLYNNPLKLKEMKNVSEEKGVSTFSYYNIAKKAIKYPI